MAENHETTILQEGPVKITISRALIGTLTYPISQIKDVNVIRQSRSLKPLLLVIPGTMFLGWSIVDQTDQFREFFNIGMILIVVGVVLVVIAKPSYAVQIRHASGEASILRSTNLTFIQRTADAINRAIARE
jgi:hypothetical protein